MNPEGLKIALDRVARESEEKTGFLDLGELGLTALPKQLFKLTHLRRLNLGAGYYDEHGRQHDVDEEPYGQNFIRKYVGRLAQLSKLESLSLCHTDLVDVSEVSGIAGLRELDCSRTWVSDLTPLVRLPKLRLLDCSDTELIDLSPLQYTRGLQSLFCTGLEISDLTPLKDLPNLQLLDFSCTQVSDLTPLKGLRKLQSVRFFSSPVRDLTPLKSLRSLQSLDCRYTPVKDLGPLKHLSNLRSIDCSGTRVGDLSPLKDLSNLRSLDCHDTRLKKLVPLKNLQSIECWLTRVSDLSPLKHSPDLQSIKCSATRLNNLGPLKNLTNLQSLDCAGTSVTSLAPLKKLTNLRSLDCRDTRIKDLSPLKGLMNLQSFDCSDTPVNRLSHLKGLANLRTLDCMWTKVSDLNPLKDLPNLQSLDCRETLVTDLTPLKALASLQSLCCRDTRITDLTPLMELPKLESLDCSACRLSATPNDFWMKSSLVNVFLSRACLPGVPAEVLSQYANDNCLESLRAHLRDLEFGHERMFDVKLMVLGNGRVGKTQICRRLRGEPYDEEVESTHGIIVTSASLPGSKNRTPARLQIWDFGGQDIYHGTHALFMRSRAIFAVAWLPQAEKTAEHRHAGFVFRNQPLGYWLEYIRHFGGTDSPTLIMQARCDKAEDEKPRPPISGEIIDSFKPPPKIVHYSAKNNRGRASLNDALSQSVEWLKEKEGIDVIGKGRAHVKRRIEEMRDIDAKKPPRERLYRTMSYEGFLALCDEAGGVSDRRQLLAYLHNAGTIFYRADLFDNRIVIDQGWVLEAIYAVLHREKCFRKLQRQNGHFTRSDLAEWIWEADGYSVEEQELFISMMQSCGICFQYRASSYDGRIEAEYIAPEFLPDRPDRQIIQKWEVDRPTERANFDYPLLIPALIRGILGRIGGHAGLAATYWRNGVYLYEASTGSRAMINQTMTGPWQGRLTVQTQRGKAALLLKRLIKMIGEEENRIGITSASGQASPTPGAMVEGVACDRLEAASTLKFTQEPTKKPEYFISYAWGDDTPEGRKREKAVNRICEDAQRKKIAVLRDKDVMHFGESIPRFMQRLVAGDRVIVVLSDKYLKSPFCMYELYEIWRRCKDDADFLKQIRVFKLPDAKIGTVRERAEHAAHWKDETSKLEELMERSGYDILSSEDYKQYKLMKDFSNHIGDILYTIATTLLPRRFEDFEPYAFD